MTKRTQILFRGIIVSVTLVLLQTSLYAQAPNWDSVYADYFIKYQPVDTPAWLFPVCFKDGMGAWDTIYIGFDSSSTFNLDSNFGEKYITIDTTKFNTGVGVGFFGDSTLKLLVYPTMSLGFNISFLNGRMPVTMYWNDSLFYSDSLPFPDLDPLPRARGELWCSDFDAQYSNCPTGYPIVLTDNTGGLSSPPILWASDSLYFDGDTTGPMSYMGSVLNLDIVHYKKPWAAIETKKDPELHFTFYPNPVYDKLTLENKKHLPFTYTIYDYLGHRIFTSRETKELITIDLSGLPNGIYFVKIELDDKSAFLSERIIKTN